ncbi:MAG TPA: DUF58 domain-containing protein [Burkholderiales bacterium]|nr:DUF58 domain-containing protein [Burkholderiales bacterium]
MPGLLRAFVRVYRFSQWTRRRFTPAGLALVYVLTAATVFGVDTRRTAAYQMFGLALGLLVIAAVASLRFRPKLTFERHLPPYATVGQAFHYRHLVCNRGPRRIAGVRLRDELAERFPNAETFRHARAARDPQVNWVDRRIGFPRWLELVRRGRGVDIEETDLVDLPPGRSVEVTLSATPLRRGILRFERCRLLRPDPLGLINASTGVNLPGELVVLPRCHPVPPLALPGARRLQPGGVALSHNVGDSEEFIQLRDYRPGDPLRRIHWPSFAKAGKPVVKEFQDEYFTRYALVLDTFGDPASDVEFEAAVSVAASFVAGLQIHDALLDLVFVEDRAYRLTVGRGLGRTLTLLRELAAVELCQGRRFELLAAHVLEHAQALSGCILVLLRMDDERRRLVKRLRGLGVQQLVLVTGSERPAPEDGVVMHAVNPRDVGGSLRSLSW